MRWKFFALPPSQWASGQLAQIRCDVPMTPETWFRHNYTMVLSNTLV